MGCYTVEEIYEFTIDVCPKALETVERTAKLCGQPVSGFMQGSAIHKAIDTVFTNKTGFIC